MYATNYHRASSLDDAAAKLAAGEDATIIAGGQTLIATMKQRLAAPTDLVDITRIPELKGITVSGDTVTIGAATTHSEVGQSSDVKGAIPALAYLAHTIGDPAVRNMGTIGGVLANNDPAADYPAAALALQATIKTTKGSHAADDYFQGMFETALEDGEIITAVEFKIPEKAGYEKFRNPASRYALCAVFVAKGKDGSVRVAVTGSGSDGVFRARDMEQALQSNFSASALDGLSADPGAMISDIHGSAEYRAHLVGVLAKRAVEKAG